MEEGRKRGRLKIFFGYAVGVGKTYAMLDDAREQMRGGVDVVVGCMEPGIYRDTKELLHRLPLLAPPAEGEFSLDAALKRKPGLILMDGLAHDNPPGARNRKRYQDVEELLNAGIDVYTTVNVQQLESLSDLAGNILHTPVLRTVPDYVFDRADKVELVDSDPEELLRRMKAGGLRNSGSSLTVEDLRLLREIALRRAADRISQENQGETGRTSSLKMLVCIGASPSSARCIRWTARSAEAFHAPWTAVYVQDRDSTYLSQAQKDTVRANMDLAEKLGAQIVTLSGRDIAAAIAEYAKVSGITNIVVGKSRRKKTFKNLLEPDLEDKLIALIPGAEVHIIPASAPPGATTQGRLHKMRIALTWPDTLKTLAILTLTTALAFMVKQLSLSDQNIILVYILAVLMVSRATSGYAYGITASIMSVLAFDFFFTMPYFSFTALSGYYTTFLIMLIIALVTSALTVGVKDQMRSVVERERRTEVLYEISRSLLAVRGQENIAALVNKYVLKLFGRAAVFYTADSFDSKESGMVQAPEGRDAGALLTPQERETAHWTFLNQKPAGAGTDTLMGAAAYYLPVVSQGQTLGVLGVACEKNGLDHSQFLLLRMIASQAAMALERQYLSDRQHKILVEAEKEKMRSNLLRAISHDLRTPLTGIYGASSAILENEEALDDATRKQLLANIREDSQWLIRMVENLLSVTRIREGSMSMAKAQEAAEEIVAEAVRRVRLRFPQRKIAVKVPQEFLMVPMDGTLIVQVLINLMENAIRHSPEDASVEVEVFREENMAVFDVIDHGEGIDPQELPALFDGYLADRQRGPDSSRGMGIGLSICKTIISAHGGTLGAANREAGGAEFRFTLPLREDESLGEQAAGSDRGGR